MKKRTICLLLATICLFTVCGIVGTVRAEAAQVSTKSPSGITANNTTQWSYVYINSSTGAESQMVYNASGKYGAGMYINNPAANDTFARLLANSSFGSANSGDVAAVYTVQSDGYLDCSIQAQMSSANGDGINVKMWINDKSHYVLTPIRVVYADGLITHATPCVAVSAGDRIYFALDKNSSISYDGGTFVAAVSTASGYPAVGKTYPGEVISGNVDYGFSHYHISEDFVERPMNYNTSASAYMNGYSGKSYNLTATDAAAFFNDKYQAGAAVNGYAARVYTVPADGTVTVDYTAVANNPAGYNNGDGFSIALALNDYAMGGLADWQYMTKTEAQAGTVKSFQQSLNVQAGDKIYFLLSKKGGPSGTYGNNQDVAKLHTAVTYTSLAAVTEETHSAGDTCLMLPVAGKTYNSYTAIAATAKANYSFARIDKNTNTLHPLAYSEAGGYNYLRATNADPSLSLDYYGYFGSNYGGGTAVNCDIATIYTAPVKMNVDVIAHGQFGKSGKGDGVIAYVYKNNFNFKLGEHHFAAGDNLYAYTISGVTLNEGDRIFVVLNCNGTNSFDPGSFTAKIKCNSINPGTAATAPASPAHPGTIQGGKIYLDPTTVGDLIDGFTDESFVNVKDTSGEYLTRYATVRTGDQVMIDGLAHTAVISGDSNGTGKTNAADVASLRSKLAGNSLTTLGELAFANDTSVASLVRRIKEVANGTYDYLSDAPDTLADSVAQATLTGAAKTSPACAISHNANEFGTVRINITNASNTNFGVLYYKTTDYEKYTEVPFYFADGDETIRLPLTDNTLFHGAIESMYFAAPALTAGTISVSLDLVSEAQYGGNGRMYFVPASYLQDGAIFQQNKPMVLWGTADCGTEVTAKLYSQSDTLLDTQSTVVTSSVHGVNVWELSLAAQSGGYNAYSVQLFANGQMIGEYTDLLFGEVWLASGQSNMQYALRQTYNSAAEIAAADDVYLRAFCTTVQPEGNGARNTPAYDVTGSWLKGDNAEIKDASAVAYFFAQGLRDELDVPVAVIQSSCGSTPVEAWISRETIDADPDVKAAMQTLGSYKETSTLYTDMGAMYYSKIAPLTHANIAGVIWYQGESNMGRVSIYKKQLSLLKEAWSEEFGFESGEIPFVFTQLAPYTREESADRLYQTQMMEQMLDFYHTYEDTTAMITIYDVSLRYIDTDAVPAVIHPSVKKPVGQRFAAAALGLVYQHGEATAPTYRSAVIDGDTVTVTFDHVGTGLTTLNDSKGVLGFALCDSSGVWVNAAAEIIGTNTVRVHSDFVSNPLYVSYAYCDMNVDANLCAGSGVPAAPFTSGGTGGLGSRSYLNCDGETFVVTSLVFTSTEGGHGEYRNLWTVTNRSAQTFDTEVYVQGIAAVKSTYTAGTGEVLAGMDLTDASLYSIVPGLANIGKLGVQVKNGDSRAKSIRLALTAANGTFYTAAQTLAAGADFTMLTFDLTTLYDANGDPVADAAAVCANMRKLAFAIDDQNGGTVWFDDIKLGA